MEINVTEFVESACPEKFSASVAEAGENAGRDTWEAAIRAHTEYDLLDTPEKRDAMRRYAASFGAWTADEIRAWSDSELNALFLQFVAGAMREGEEGEVYRGDNGEYYYYVGE